MGFPNREVSHFFQEGPDCVADQKGQKEQKRKDKSRSVSGPSEIPPCREMPVA